MSDKREWPPGILSVHVEPDIVYLPDGGAAEAWEQIDVSSATFTRIDLQLRWPDGYAVRLPLPEDAQRRLREGP